jgi:hypothetical protein
MLRNINLWIQPILCALIFAGVILSGGDGRGQTTEPSRRVLATVNGDSITADMLVEELGRIHMAQSGPIERSDFSVDRLLNKLINNRLLAQDARALELDREPEVVEQVRKFREALVFPYFLKDHFQDTSAISETEILSTFSEYFRTYQLRFICVNDTVLAAALADSIRSGVPMAELAGRHSVDKFKDKGGDGGSYALALLPLDLQRRLRVGQIGDLYGPLYLWKVWTVIRVESERAADPAQLDSLRKDVVALANELRKRAARTAMTDSLRLIYPVHVDSNLVDSVIVQMLAGLPADDRPVVTVGAERKLTALELRNKYIHRVTGRSDREAHALLNDVLGEQVETMLLKEAAAQLDYRHRPVIQTPVAAFEDSILIVTYLNEIIGSSSTVTEQAIEHYYTDHPQAFRTHGRFRIATLTRGTKDDADSSFSRLKNGADFDWLARRESEDDLKSKGGVRDWMAWGEFPPSWHAMLDTLRVGGILPPCEVDVGFWIIKLLEREPDGTIPLESVRDRVRDVLMESQQMEAIDRAVTALRSSADIIIFEDAVEQTRLSGKTEQ